MIDLKDIQRYLFPKSSKPLTVLQNAHNEMEIHDDFIKNFLGERVKFDRGIRGTQY